MSISLGQRFHIRAARHLKFAVSASRSIASSAELDIAHSRPSESHSGSVTSSELSKNSAPSSGSGVKEWSERLDSVGQKARLPRSVQALYLRPLRRKPEFGLPVCDLQLRSYSVRNLEFFADFALRAAYYLELPVSGPVPLPRIVERWTFPRSNFVHKKSQENFERITLRRLIQIKDGHPQAVQAWLAFLRKHAFYGVGMKANVWDHESLDVARNMDESLPDIEKSLEPYLSHFGYRSDGSDQSAVFDLLENASQLRNWRKETFATLIAVGLDPNRSTIFYQSAVHAHAELFWILCTIASMGYLSRMTQWKSKLQLPDNANLEDSTARSRLRLGLFSYPVLQAADILVHRATHVPVGDDQRQHLEFSRNTANSFNHVYGPIFPSPEAIISPAKRVMSLKEPTLKMSKSHADRRSRIILTDSPAEISKKINAALTDSELTITYDPRDVPAVVSLDIKRSIVSDPVVRDRVRRKRDKTIGQTLDNAETLYFCNVTLGTPGQALRLVLDTGSSDLWCNAANSTLCSDSNDSCNISGSYDPSSSSTYAYVSSDFNISYADGTGAVGDYATDILHIGGSTLRNLQFGIGYSSTSSEGVLGIGYPSNEVQVGQYGKDTYPNLPRAMVDQGLINSNAYSLWLNDLESNTGSILFGGVNTGKYLGELQTLPIQKVNGRYSEFVIALTGVAFDSESHHKTYSSDALPAAVLLDSGSSLTYLPDSIVENIYRDLNVAYEPSSGVGYLPCKLAGNNINITYTFSSPNITVMIDELLLDAGDLRFRDGARACIFGIVPAGDSTAVLGDTFLRSAYVVYDIANNEISIANTNFNSTEDNILEIGVGPDSVPSATQVSHPVTSVVADGSGARIGAPTGASSTTVPSISSAGALSAGVARADKQYLAIALIAVWFVLGL
ncbi:hypothetical protein KXX41_005796 [Aspergillus fumigatus]|nr:hypothetical protein KXX41_005796 [Aspergillus fumigatus]